MCHCRCTVIIMSKQPVMLMRKTAKVESWKTGRGQCWWRFIQQPSEASINTYLSMLGWQSLFMSCTSRSMLALLLASVFIFSAITCPVIRCCTWNTSREVLQWMCDQQLVFHQQETQNESEIQLDFIAAWHSKDTQFNQSVISWASGCHLVGCGGSGAGK